MSIDNKAQQDSGDRYNSVKHEIKKFTVETMAGIVGGGLGTYIGYPFETVKTLRQYQATSHSTIIQNIYTKNGLKGFFHGVTAPLISYTALTATAIASYKYIQKSLDPSMTSYRVMLFASTISGFLQLIPAVPGEIVKIRQQIEAQKSHKEQTTIRQCIQMVYREQGVRGFYRGISSQIYRDLPANVAYFMSYDLINQYLLQHSNCSMMARAFWSGAFSGVLSWFVIVPLDVTKTLVQSGRCHSFLDAVHFLWRSGKGYEQYFRGLSMILSRAFVANSITFTAYETVIQMSGIVYE